MRTVIPGYSLWICILLPYSIEIVTYYLCNVLLIPGIIFHERIVLIDDFL